MLEKAKLCISLYMQEEGSGEQRMVTQPLSNVIGGHAHHQQTN